MAISLVQTATGNGGNYVLSMNLAFGSSVTAGNLIVVAVCTQTYAVNTITDTLSNTYTKISDGQTANLNGELWYAYNITGGSCTLTVDLIGTTNYDDIITTAREYSGISTTSPLDVSAENVEGSYGTSHPTGTTGTTNQADEVCVAMYAGDDNETYTVGGSYTNLVDTDGYDLYSSLVMADLIVSSTGTQSATFTSTDSLRGYGAIATFKAAASAAANNATFFGCNF